MAVDFNDSSLLASFIRFGVNCSDDKRQKTLSAVNHLDGKSHFLNTGLKLGIFKYMYI